MKLTEEQEQYIVENCNSVDLEEMYDDMLDDCGPILICGLEYEISQVLKKVDPTAYRCGMVDYEDSLRLVEIDGDYYMPDDIETALEDFADLQEEDEDEDEEEDED